MPRSDIYGRGLDANGDINNESPQQDGVDKEAVTPQTASAADRSIPKLPDENVLYERYLCDRMPSVDIRPDNADTDALPNLEGFEDVI